MIYFTADTHFFHSNIINLCDRPFKNVDEMNKVLIRNWNSYITELDEIYILGDFLFKGTGSQANAILNTLKGKKYLIRGNHDKFLNDENFDMSAFEWVKDYFVLNYKKMKFVLFIIRFLNGTDSSRILYIFTAMFIIPAKIPDRINVFLFLKIKLLMSVSMLITFFR